MTAKKQIAIYWFKRDLRLTDLDGLKAFSDFKIPILFLYIYEPQLWSNTHYSQRHLDFIKQSIVDMNLRLSAHGGEVLPVISEVLPLFEKLNRQFEIVAVHSSEETGLEITYQRDKDVAAYFKNNGIPWNEFQNNGVTRGIRDRDHWREDWYAYMNTTIPIIDLDEFTLMDWSTSLTVNTDNGDGIELLPLETSRGIFQMGGAREAKEWEDSFFNLRVKFYNAAISKPLLSRMGCSRLSPYISWGNVSIRQLYQRAIHEKKASSNKRALNAFVSRLRWQSHFIQKFEQEPRMEFEAINKGYLSLSYPVNQKFIDAWKTGRTGYPLVDAAMRAVVETGYINFRMRALVTSFLCHHLFQHFTTGSDFLAAQFLDWEPGIHYGQFQMQSGLTGTNTLRIYNPTKGALDHDPDALFIKRYIPELSNLSSRYAIQPWLLEEELHEYHDFEYGVDYPRRIVDITQTRKEALSKIYSRRKQTLVQQESKRILAAHSMKRRMA